MLSYQLPLSSMLLVIAAESLFQAASVAYYRKASEARTYGMVLQLLADVSFLTLLLSLSGGATNAFVSLLLLPIMIAAVILSPGGLALVAGSAIAAYSGLLLTMPHHAMHHVDMEQHFIGMWVNFVFSAAVVALVVGTLAREIANRERAIARSRESQLQKEQLIALGSAAAQVTHQMATPLANLQLLYEELEEQLPDNEAVKDMHQPLESCREQISHFRALAVMMREGGDEARLLDDVLEQLQNTAALQFPDQQFDFDSAMNRSVQISGDPLLLSALLNLIQNAVSANRKRTQSHISLTVSQEGANCVLVLRDQGPGFDDDRLKQLGSHLVTSEAGLGMAVMLSNATFDRLGGALKLANHPDGGALVTVIIPILSGQHHETTDH